jgi:hypothetical protein
MSKKNFDFANMSGYQLEKANLRGGMVDIAKLIKDEFSDIVSTEALQQIRGNKQSVQVFEEWLKTNIDTEDAKLIRIFYGKKKMSDIDTLFDSDMAWETAEENEKQYNELMDQIRHSLNCGGLLKALVGA